MRLAGGQLHHSLSLIVRTMKRRCLVPFVNEAPRIAGTRQAHYAPLARRVAAGKEQLVCGAVAIVWAC